MCIIHCSYIIALYMCRFFETFDVVSEVSTEDRLKILDMTSKCSSKEAVGETEREGGRGGERGRAGGRQREGGEGTNSSSSHL